MKTPVRICNQVFVVFLFLFSVCDAKAISRNSVTDMVLVPAPKPFYISIFEATTNNQKVASFRNYAEAKSYCEQKGLRLPTREEWMLAASALGKNRNFTLKGDGQDANNKFNYYGRNSVGVYDIGRLGIDAIGTVGMSGNRSEWVVNGDGSHSQCGGQYREQDQNLFRLDQICADKGSPRYGTNVTVRCVTEYVPSLQVELSPNIQGGLAQYIQQLTRARKAKEEAEKVPEAPPAPLPKPKLDEEF